MTRRKDEEKKESKILSHVHRKRKVREILFQEKKEDKIMYVVIREMRPHLTGYDVPECKIKEFIKKYKEKGTEITIFKDGKIVKKISRK